MIFFNASSYNKDLSAHRQQQGKCLINNKTLLLKRNNIISNQRSLKHDLHNTKRFDKKFYVIIK